jgi:uncharacterized protein (TIGR03435 family)
MIRQRRKLVKRRRIRRILSMRRLLIVLLLAAPIFVNTLGAQAPAPATLRFEAASVKRNTTPDFVLGRPRFQGETFTARQVWVALLIANAYGVPTREVVDGPSWIYDEQSKERFDIVAKAAAGSSPEDMRAMLRHMLEDRFKLRLRLEKREMPVYLLTKVDSDGPLGPNLRRAVKDCLPRTACEGTTGGGSARYLGADWSIVLSQIANSVVDRRVIDRTGLSGSFDFELTFRRGLAADPNDPQADIFTAVRQQFGLKLESGRAPFDVAVVERVERPTPD